MDLTSGVSWFRGSAVRIRRGDREIHVDPCGLTESGTADYILLTHPHYDNFSEEDIARVRGVAADSVVANLVERGLLAEAGRSDDAGAIEYRTTPLFERIFGLGSLAELPRLDDLGGDAAEIRKRLEQIAASRGA